MVKMMSTPESLWLMRKQFAMEMSAISFLTYFSCLTNRAPARFHLSRKTGRIYMTEILLGTFSDDDSGGSVELMSQASRLVNRSSALASKVCRSA